jgi:hypothetical protein
MSDLFLKRCLERGCHAEVSVDGYTEPWCPAHRSNSAEAIEAWDGGDPLDYSEAPGEWTLREKMNWRDRRPPPTSRSRRVQEFPEARR